MTNSLTKYVSDWFARGDDDLALVKLILEQGTGSANLACFHAQQVAEKYLKGFLAYRDLHVRKIHDLEILLKDCETVDPSFSQLQDDARFLIRFYAESRYPDDYVEFSRQDAEVAYAATLRIKEFVLSKVKPSETNGGFGLVGIIIALAVVVLVSGGGLYYYRNQQLITDNLQPATNNKSTEEIEQNQAAVNESAVDTSNWKMYRNEKYGFEMKTPPPWEVIRKGMNNNNLDNYAEIYSNDNYDSYDNSPGEENNGFLGTLSVFAGWDMQQAIQYHRSEFEDVYQGRIKISHEEKINISGREAIIIYTKSPECLDCTELDFSRLFFIPHNGNTVVISEAGRLSKEEHILFDEVLAVFKFIK